MQISFYSVVMTVLWSSLLISLFSLLRRKGKLLEICSASGAILLYLFCAVRIAVPIELPWVVVVPSEYLLNPLYSFFMKPVIKIGKANVCVFHLFLICWAVGAIFLMSRLIYQYLRLSKEIDALGGTEDEKLYRILEEVAQREKRNVHPKILRCNGIDGPMSTGIIHQKIIIPDHPFSDVELYYIIKHEYTHLHNQDPLVQMMFNALCAIYWWNPFVYTLRKNLQHDFEVRCDQEVVRDLGESEIADYLDTLISVLYMKFKMPHKENDLLVNAVDNRKGLAERFDLLAGSRKLRHRKYGKIGTVMIVAATLVLSYTFILQSKFVPENGDIASTSMDQMIDSENSYIVHKQNGDYVLITNEGSEVVLENKNVEELKEIGIKMEDEQ